MKFSEMDIDNVLYYLEEGNLSPSERHTLLERKKQIESEIEIIEIIEIKNGSAQLTQLWKNEIQSFNTIATQEYKPREWLVENLIRDGLISIVAPSGHGKSVMLASILNKMATGQDFLGHKAGKPRKSIWLDWENEPVDLQKIIKGQGWDEVTMNMVDRLDPVDLPDITNQNRYFEMIDALAREYDVIWVDTLESAHPHIDHNKANEVKPLYDEYRRVYKNTGCTIGILDHTNKMAYQSENINIEGMVRGTGSKLSACSSTIIFRNRPDGNMEFFIKGRGLGHRYMIIKKVPEVYGFEYVSEYDGKAIEVSSSLVQEAILQAIKELEGDATNKSIAEFIGKDPGQVSVECGKLEAMKKIYKEGSRRNPWKLVTDQLELPF